MEKPEMTATEWIREWLKEFPDTEIIVSEARQRGESDEEVKAFLEGL